MNQQRRYYVAELAYPGRPHVLFHSSRFCVVADSIEDALSLLRPIVVEVWQEFSPHPPPDIVNLIPGRLILELEEAYQRADERRSYG